jgi:hypothetical protein
MKEVVTRWISADVMLVPRENGRPQQPSHIFGGYRNSNLRFERMGGGYALPVGGATLFPVDHDELGVGETGSVRMHVYGEDALNTALCVGARFLLTEGGRPVVLGMITALLPDASDPPSAP